MASIDPKSEPLTPAEAYRRARRFRLMRTIRMMAMGVLWCVFAVTVDLAPHWFGLGFLVVLLINGLLDRKDARGLK